MDFEGGKNVHVHTLEALQEETHFNSIKKVVTVIDYKGADDKCNSFEPILFHPQKVTL